MRYRLEYSPKAIQDLSRLDKQTSLRIVTKLDFFIEQANPLRWAKNLTSSRYGEYRFRVGEYRIVFDLAKDGSITILLILRIKHRREVYE